MIKFNPDITIDKYISTNLSRRIDVTTTKDFVNFILLFSWICFHAKDIHSKMNWKLKLDDIFIDLPGRITILNLPPSYESQGIPIHQQQSCSCYSEIKLQTPSFSKDILKFSKPWGSCLKNPQTMITWIH